MLAAVARAKDGDPDALRYLYLRYADNVYGYVCSIVRDEYEAEDVTQHIFAKLLTSLPRYEPRVVPFSAWILRVAHNAAIDHVRARRPVPVEDVLAADAPDDRDGGRERFADLRLALDAPCPRSSATCSSCASSSGSRRARSPSGSAARRTPCTGCSTAAGAGCAARCWRSRPSAAPRSRACRGRRAA